MSVFTFDMTGGGAIDQDEHPIAAGGGNAFTLITEAFSPTLIAGKVASTPLRKQESIEVTPPDFEELFETGQFKYKVVVSEVEEDEGVFSFDEATLRSRPSTSQLLSPLSPMMPMSPMSPTSGVFCGSPTSLTALCSPVRAPPVQRKDSVMDQTFSEMLTKNRQNCSGFTGFRKRLGKELVHKYCSGCKFDDMIIVFLHVVLGMAYISAGVLGLTGCSDENSVNYYLIIVGTLSVFIFPITVMEWTQRICGCVDEDNKLSDGVYFVFILLMRLLAAVIGTVLLSSRWPMFESQDIYCLSIVTCLNLSVYLEWLFLFCALCVPFFCFGVLYLKAGGWCYYICAL